MRETVDHYNFAQNIVIRLLKNSIFGYLRVQILQKEAFCSNCVLPHVNKGGGPVIV